MLELLAIASLGGLVAVVLAPHPRAAMTLWLIVMVFVPVWIEVRLGPTLPPLSLLFLALLPAVIYARGHGGKWGLTRGDVAVATFVALASVSFFFENAPTYAFATIFTSYLPAYLIGRLLAPAVGWPATHRMLSVATTVAAVWAVLEYVFGWHVFADFLGTTGDSANWHLIQERGPYTRSEAAFGHSIALGGFLSLGLPFIIASSYKLGTKLGMTALVFMGIGFSFSRAAVLTTAAVLVLSLIGLRRTLDAATRRMLWCVIGAGAITGPPFVLGVLSQIEDDFTASTDYRIDLLETIWADMRPFGQALGVHQDAAGGGYLYHGFRSIDNAWLLAVLQFGWVPVLVVLIVGIAIIWRVIRARDVYPAHIAFVAQLGMVFTVALITQLGSAIWMIAGMCGALSGVISIKRTTPRPTRAIRLSDRLSR